MRGVTEHPLAVFADGRGSLLKAHPGRVEGEVYAIVVTPGASRGHHLHRLTTEVFVAVSGEGVVGVLDPGTGEVEHIPLQRRLEVGPGIAHAIFNLGDTELVVVAAMDRPHDPDDVLRHEVPAP
ncbi:MAG TPA: cupin domain-containing protein [Myxococcota bacterium]|nr:cupin domain-containing protein [Myxococcota bacterium]